MRLNLINPLKLQSVPFSNRNELPNCPAVYFLLKGKEVLYIGSTKRLCLRWVNHHVLRQLEADKKDISIAWLKQPEKSLNDSERELIKRFLPKYNHNFCKIKPAKPKARRSSNRQPNPMRKDIEQRFKPKSDVPLNKKNVVSVSLPSDLYEVVRTLPNRSEWLRQVIAEKLEREDLAKTG